MCDYVSLLNAANMFYRCNGANFQEKKKNVNFSFENIYFKYMEMIRNTYII